jgi:hypothetical protein
MARHRLPHWADRIAVGNALDWIPGRSFDFVRTGLEYAPAPLAFPRRTARLDLRPVMREDRAAIHRLYSDWRVADGYRACHGHDP